METQHSSQHPKKLTLDDYLLACDLFCKGMKQTPLKRIIKLAVFYFSIMLTLDIFNFFKFLPVVSIEMIIKFLPIFFAENIADKFLETLVIGLFLVFFSNLWIKKIQANHRRKLYQEFVEFPALNSETKLSFNNSLISLIACNEAYTRSIYWHDLTFFFKNDQMAILGLSKTHYVIIPFNWFDTEELKEKFIGFSKTVTHWQNLS